MNYIFMHLDKNKMKSYHANESALVRTGQMAGERSWTHLCHFKDALWIQAASAHLPHAGDRALVGDRDDQARQRAGFLLQSCINNMSVTHLQKKQCMFCCAIMDFGNVSLLSASGLTLHRVTIQGTFSTFSLIQSYGSSDSSISFPPSSSDDICTLGIL